jgi:F-type H+-transporting ATPase subunit alpha
MVATLNQPQYRPWSLDEQVVAIYAGTNGYLDDIPVGQVRRFEEELLETFRTRYHSLLDHIRTQKDLPDGLADAVAEFKAGFVAAAEAQRQADATATDAEALGEAESAKTLATE